MQVIVLRALQSRLLEALSKVHNGAAQLAVLRRLEKEALPEVAAAGSEPSEGERQRLLSGAKRATRKCIESILSVRHRLCKMPQALPLLIALEHSHHLCPGQASRLDALYCT